MTAAHKQLVRGTPKLSSYSTTDWLPANTERRALPAAISLAALYTALLSPLTPISMWPGENMSEIVERLKLVQKLEREIAVLERKIRNEPQLNRKIELRRTLKIKQTELEKKGNCGETANDIARSD